MPETPYVTHKQAVLILSGLPKMRRVQLWKCESYADEPKSGRGKAGAAAEKETVYGTVWRCLLIMDDAHDKPRARTCGDSESWDMGDAIRQSLRRIGYKIPAEFAQSDLPDVGKQKKVASRKA